MTIFSKNENRSPAGVMTAWQLAATLVVGGACFSPLVAQEPADRLDLICSSADGSKVEYAFTYTDTIMVNGRPERAVDLVMTDNYISFYYYRSEVNIGREIKIDRNNGQIIWTIRNFDDQAGLKPYLVKGTCEKQEARKKLF